jgi:DNA replication protein DnaC
MHPTDELIPILKKLRLSGVLQTLELRTRQAIDDNLAHSEFLLRLLADEIERRDAKQLDQRLRRASFEHAKSLEDFDFTFNPKIPKAKIIDLATCAFVERRENVCLVGPTGVGKSHIAQALGHRACVRGHNVLYTSAHDLLVQLRAARADASHERKLLRYTTPDLLVIDDLGLRPLVGDEPLDLYEIIRRRYERGALLITSNRALSEWPPLFKDELLASAAMDRLLHHAHVIEVPGGSSYRNPPRGTTKVRAA